MGGGRESIAEGPVSVRGLEHATDGYLHGLRQPYLQARLSFALPGEIDWSCLDAALAAARPTSGFPAPPPPDTPLSDEPLAGAVARILRWTPAFQRGADDVVFEDARVLWRSGDGAALSVLALPTVDANIAMAALTVVAGMVNRLLRDPAFKGAGAAPALVAASQADIDHLLQQRDRNPVSSEMGLFLKAAYERRIPWLRLGTTGAFQIGYGVRGRWFDGPVTETTSLTSAKIARNKAAAASLLRQAGLPTPAHWAVTDEASAVSAAESLGYPVVVKAADLDGGQGVHVGLRNAAAVRKAYREARTLSERILVEAYVDGRDYRMVVLNGKLIWVVERVPGSVIGDGVSTIAQLIEQVNADPRRGVLKSSELIKLSLDDEAIMLLEEHGMDGASTPGAGVFVRLRGAANVARGGYPVPAFDNVHPDNRLLAERAARLLRLDVAGVDLIAPHISRSWKETGGAICEINASPAFGLTSSGHVYGQILDTVIQGEGRIPIGLMVGAPAGAAALTARIAAAAGVRVGWSDADGVWIGDEHVLPVSPDVFTGARLLLGDASVGAAVIAANDTGPSRTGLPFDRFNVLALAGAALADGGDFQGLARSLLPMSAGKVVINAEDGACAALAPHASSAALILYAARSDHPALAEHRAAGGAAVWVEASPEGPRLILATGGDRSISIALGDPGQSSPLDFSPAAIALAAATAGALGCGEGHLRKGLADVRVAG